MSADAQQQFKVRMDSCGSFVQLFALLFVSLQCLLLAGYKTLACKLAIIST